MDNFIKKLRIKRPNYTTRNWVDELVVSLNETHHVKLHKTLLEKVPFDDLVEFIDEEMKKLINKY